MTKLDFARQIFSELVLLPDATATHLDDWSEATFWGFVYFDGRAACRDRKLVSRLSRQIRRHIKKAGADSTEHGTSVTATAPEPQYSTERNSRGRKQFEKYEHDSFQIRLTIYG